MRGKVYFELASWYHGTKHALEEWSDRLRVDVKELGIDVVIVEPGIINMNFFTVMNEKGGKYIANSNYGHMYKRLQEGSFTLSEPEELAEVINEIVETQNQKQDICEVLCHIS